MVFVTVNATGKLCTIPVSFPEGSSRSTILDPCPEATLLALAAALNGGERGDDLNRRVVMREGALGVALRILVRGVQHLEESQEQGREAKSSAHRLELSIDVIRVSVLVFVSVKNVAISCCPLVAHLLNH